MRYCRHMSTLTAAIETGPWTSERIHDELLRRILDREITHESVLLETELGAELGVSRTPIREAVSRLVEARLLERGTRGLRLVRSSPAEMLDLYQARIALEVEAAGLAAERHLPLDLARLEHLLELAGQTQDAAEALAVNAAWHRTLRSTCHNNALQELLERVSVRLRVAEGNDISAHDPAVNVEDHQAIIEAIRARDAERARTAMRHHLTRVRDLRTRAIARESRGLVGPGHPVPAT